MPCCSGSVGSQIRQSALLIQLQTWQVHISKRPASQRLCSDDHLAARLLQTVSLRSKLADSLQKARSLKCKRAFHPAPGPQQCWACFVHICSRSTVTSGVQSLTLERVIKMSYGGVQAFCAAGTVLSSKPQTLVVVLVLSKQISRITSSSCKLEGEPKPQQSKL